MKRLCEKYQVWLIVERKEEAISKTKLVGEFYAPLGIELPPSSPDIQIHVSSDLPEYREI